MNKKITTSERPICQFRQLCAIAKQELPANQMAADWKEAIKVEAVRLGFQSPLTESVYRAMEAVGWMTIPAPSSKP